ncbi:hypothetical protein [Jiangella sp. DSM 45060]|uniref:hypothetical protein n=1 Tax=Jiangella sp. DSM 45060 TaxID=1798224 RepID=UPI000B888505|nr:hypothetical protein [Jiangella sp. DSM 45060]
MAFQIPSRPAPVIEIRGLDGLHVTEGRDRFATIGPRGWTEMVRQLGYKPIGRWTKVPPDYAIAPPGAAHMCRVEPAPVLDVAGYAAAHLAAGLLPTCAASTSLTRALVAELGGDEFGFSVGDVVECEYVGAHRGPHHGLGQPGRFAGVDERYQLWTWLLWSGDQVTVSEALLCGAEEKQPGGAGDPCALPLGHDDASPPHSWQLTIFNTFRPGVRRAAARRDPQLRWPGKR